MTITGKQLLDLSRNGRDLHFKVLGSCVLGNAGAVLKGEYLFVSEAAFKLICDDPEIRDEVIAGLQIQVIRKDTLLPTDMNVDWFHNLN